MTSEREAIGNWPRAIFFDLDGTLAHTLPDLAESVDETLSGLGLTACGEQRVRSWIGRGVEHLMRQALRFRTGEEPDRELFNSAMQRFHLAHEKNNGRRALLYPGVKALLERQLGAGRRLACITNKAERYALPLLAQLGIDRLLALTVCGDTTSARKPDPLPLRHALERLALSPDEVVHVGDSENDTKAADAAGIAVVGVSYGYCRGRMENLVRRVARSATDLESLIDSSPGQ